MNLKALFLRQKYVSVSEQNSVESTAQKLSSDEIF